MTGHASRRGILKSAAHVAALGALMLNRTGLAAAREQGALRADTTNKIDALLRAAVDAGDLPGVVAMAAGDNGIIYEGAFGTRRLPDDDAMTRDTVFRVASMIKPITTVAALQLVERDKLSLDAPVPPIEPALGAPQVLDGFDEQGRPQLRPAKRPIAVARAFDPHVGLRLPAVGCEGCEIYRGVGANAGERSEELAADALDVRSGRALAIWRRPRLGRPPGGSRQRGAARRLFPPAHF